MISFLRMSLMSSMAVGSQFLPGAAFAQVSTLSAADADSSLNEIIVTAQKREERLQDVPVPVTVISAASLVDSNKLNVKDFYTSVPGLNILPGQNGGSSGTTVAVRGLTTGAGNPTVGIVIDDVPFGSSTFLGGGGPVPEFDPSDLGGIEVLRGPQGTLYGANSLGGLLKYVTVDPSTTAVSGRIEAGVNTVKKGDIGYSLRGALNLPVSETVAVRVSGFGRRDAGYIDNVQTGEDDVNRTNAYGARASLLWRPEADFSLKLGAKYQRDKIQGFPYADANLADLQQSRLIGTGATTLKTQVYSAIASGRLGGVDLTSLTGYSVYQLGGYRDFTFAFGAPLLANFGVRGGEIANPAKTKKFSQELRLSATIGDAFDILAGGFYTHEKSVLGTNLRAINPATGAFVALVLDQPINTTYEEIAAFGDLTYHISDKFSVQFGGRVSKIRQHYQTVYRGPYNGIFIGKPDPFAPPEQNTKDDTFTYLVTPQYKFSRDLMAYARIATGYRPGGPNSNNGTTPLPTYEPDKTQNYEFGLKGDFLDRTLSIDTSVFRIDWKDIQLAVIDPTSRAQIFINASRAKSEGAELSVTLRPATGTSLSGWISYNNAKLTRSLPAGLNGTAVGLSGDRLPVSSRYSGRISLNQEFDVSDAAAVSAGIDLNYVGKRLGFFQRAGVARQVYPHYIQVDLRAGLTMNDWSVKLFANNITDKRGLLPSGTGDPIAIYPIQPRTIGLNIARSF